LCTSEVFWEQYHWSNIAIGGFHGTPKLVFLPVWSKAGDIFFVDGQLGMGILTRYIFPVINMRCSRSALVQDAAVDLRVLRDGPPEHGVRVIGQVVKVKHEPEYERRGVPQIPVTISGPMGSIVTMTDEEGIYDLKNIPDGTYSIRANGEDEIMRDSTLCKINGGRFQLHPHDVWGCTLYLRNR
jgi:hypothetical protein